jgi:hypothetical protein
VLRDDALKAEFAGVLENGRTVARDVFVDLDADAGGLRKEFFEPCSVQNERPNQINNFTSDQEQYRPYQIVDLLLKIGHSLRSLLRLRREYASQEEKDGYRSRDYPYQLIHNAMPLRFNPTTTANVLLEQSADRERPEGPTDRQRASGSQFREETFVYCLIAARAVRPASVITDRRNHWLVRGTRPADVILISPRSSRFFMSV